MLQSDIAEAEQQNVPIRPEMVMRAPLAGVVVQKMVLPGQFIQAGTTAAFVISNTSTVWVQGHVYDKDLASVHVGDKVDERNSSFPEPFHGVVSYIGDMLDPATRTTPVRIVTENPDGLLKKDLFVDVVIHDKTTRDVLVVPTAAVLYDEQNFPFVYVQVEPGKFAQRLVKIGSQQGDDTQVVEGFKEGEPVVCAGQRVPAVREHLPVSNAMINRIVSFALAQRFIVIVAMICLAVWGIVSFQNLPIDAYPDLSPPRVQIVTQWPGHAAEEVERLITIPLEVEMNGIPKLDALRSISLYGLSSMTMNFQYDTDPYFAREQAFERHRRRGRCRAGVTPGMSPLFSPSGLIYRYVLQSPDRSAQELKILQDWVLERRYRAIQGVADDSSLGGETMQYQVQIDPNRLMSYGVTVPQIVQQLAEQQRQRRRRLLLAGRPVLLRARPRPGRSRSRTSATSSSRAMPAFRCTVNDVGTVAIGHAPRLGQFGYMKQDDAVEGVILMRVGEQAQVILKKVQELTATLNRTRDAAGRQDRPVLRPDRSDSGDDPDRRAQSAARDGARAGGSRHLPVQRADRADRRRHDPVRAAVLVHLPRLGAHSGEPAVDRRDRLRHDRRRRRRDGGEHLPRAGGAARAEIRSDRRVIRAAAKDVERPIFYAIAVIIAGYLPIYVLTGPSGRLFRPMADTMAFALVGSLLCSLTLLPVLCAIFLRKHVKEPMVSDVRLRAARLRSAARTLACSTAPRRWPSVVAIFGASLLLVPFIGAEFMPHLDEGALWVRATMPYTISFDEASKLGPQVREILLELSAGHYRCQRAGASRRWHRSDRVLQRRIFRRPEAVRRFGLVRIDPDQAAADRRDPAEAQGVSRHHLQLHAAGRGCGGRSGNRAQELAGGEDFRRRPRTRSRSKAEAVQTRAGDRARHHARRRSCASWGSRA